MKKILFFLFSIVFCLSISAQVKKENGDYLNVDERGMVTSFRITAKDNSVLEVIFVKEYRDKFKILLIDSDGAEWRIPYSPENATNTSYRGYGKEMYSWAKEHMDSFDKFWSVVGVDHNHHRANDDFWENVWGDQVYTIHEGGKGDWQRYDYSSKLDKYIISESKTFFNDNGDYYHRKIMRRMDEHNQVFYPDTIDNNSLYDLYLSRTTLEDKRIVTQTQGVVFKIEYPNGDVFFDKRGHNIYDFEPTWPLTIESLNAWEKTRTGTLTKKDGSVEIYNKGEIDEVETIVENKRAIAKKEAEEKRKAEERETLKQMNSKYGASNVSAILAGKLPIGCPEELFLLAVKSGALKSITNVERFYSSGSVTRYYVYGWTANSSGISNSGFLGTVRFFNGKLESKTF